MRPAAGAGACMLHTACLLLAPGAFNRMHCMRLCHPVSANPLPASPPPSLRFPLTLPQKEAKATMKPLGRMLAKIMHAAPLAVAEQLIRQVREGWRWAGMSGGDERLGAGLSAARPDLTSPPTLSSPLPHHQVMGMPGMVTSIVESLKYLTPMAFDVMTFAILKQLASPKKKLKARRAGRGGCVGA